MKVVAVLLVAFAVVALAADAEQDEGVFVYTQDNFDAEIVKHDLTLVEFYAPWCGHCKALAPEYAEAAKTINAANGKLGALAKVDCTTEREVCNKFEVRGFPTVKLFSKDNVDAPTDYDQARKADAIVKFMKKQTSPAVSELKADEAESFAADESIKVILFGAANEAFTKAAKALRNEYSFGWVKEGDSKIVMYRDFDEGNLDFDGDASDEKAITSFIKDNAFPLVGEIGPENYQKYLERGYNFVWVFINPEDAKQTEMITNSIVPVAAANKGKFSFVKLDGVKWAEHAKTFGLSGSTPGIVIEDQSNAKKFVFPEDKDVTPEAFKDFVDQYNAGTLTPFVKSEPIPESNDGPVTVVVGKQFDEIVLDANKNVMVEFYAPWCGHCKSLAPKYEEVGQNFADDASVVIAKVDATANDTPAEIRGYPTLLFYPAGAENKANPISYEGGRTAEDITSWIKEKSVQVAAPAAGEGDSKDEL